MKLLDKLHNIFNRRSTKELKHITGAVGNSLEIARQDIFLLDLEYIIGTSTGEWLDEWGSWFGISRYLNEYDSSYSSRILAVATKPKDTIPALIETVNTQLDTAGTKVFEPHVRIARHNVSKFSGINVYQDGVYWRWNVADILIPGNLTDSLRTTINDVKAAGVRIFYTANLELKLDVNDSFKYIPNGVITLMPESPKVNYMSGARYSNSSYNRSRSGGKKIWGIYSERGTELAKSVFMV